MIRWAHRGKARRGGAKRETREADGRGGGEEDTAAQAEAWMKRGITYAHAHGERRVAAGTTRSRLEGGER